MPTAAVYHGARDVRVEDRTVREHDSDEVLLDVAACGICGSDLHEYSAGPLLVPTEKSQQSSGETVPIVLGHEFTGTVQSVGSDVDRVATGQAVTVMPKAVCGTCPSCNRGQYQLCDSKGTIGLTSGLDGGFAEEAVVPASQLIPLPDDVPLAAGALAEPLTVGLHAVRRSGLSTGDTVAIFGSGPIGLAVLVAARSAGARTVIVSEPLASRRDRAEMAGADEALDPGAGDPLDHVYSVTNGGVDVAFEVAGIEATLDQAVRCTRKGGTITVVSTFEDAVDFQPNALVHGERSVVGSRGYLCGPLADAEWQTTLRILSSGAASTELFVTDRIPLEDIVDRGFEALLEPECEHVKILVEP